MENCMYPNGGLSLAKACIVCAEHALIIIRMFHIMHSLSMYTVQKNISHIKNVIDTYITLASMQTKTTHLQLANSLYCYSLNQNGMSMGHNVVLFDNKINIFFREAGAYSMRLNSSHNCL